ncbi:MAG: ribosome maturation factor RimM [Dehalococcoidia bacterium]|tara:strand:+ start:191 stop:688 length:498 start_codon:yes stop_codon:yes gene_type:complete
MDSKNLILIGRIIKTTGIDGFVIIQSYSKSKIRFCVDQEFYIQNKLYKVEETKNSNKHHKVRFFNINSLENAKSLIGKNIMQREEMLPSKTDDAFYHYQILESNILTDDGISLGKVEQIIETGSNDILVVKNNKKEILIPLLSKVLIKYIKETNTTIIHLPYKIN